MSTQRFVAELSVVGNSLTVPIPFDPDVLWGERGWQGATGTINGRFIRGQLQRGGDGWYLTLGLAWRRDAGLDLSASVTVELEPEGPLLEEQAADIAAAVGGSVAARAFFESIAPFYRKNYLRWIEEARRPETRAARIAEAVLLLERGEMRR